MKIYDLLDPYTLLEHEKAGRVSAQKHPTLPLLIYNYTQKAQFENVWGDGTIDYCRGLIVCTEGPRAYEIISRPFKKFHNLNTERLPETCETNLPKTTPTITQKYDGSLGILWDYDGHFGIATRGSFTSPQAQWATAWLENEMKKGHVDFPREVKSYTYLFEIIYQENRIVVQYPWEGLILLSVLNNETGEEWSHSLVEAKARLRGFRVARSIRDKNIFDCIQQNIPNEEGYVVTYGRVGTDPLKVKIKMADYVRLHKIVTGMNARSVWEILSTGKDMEGLQAMPEHFKKWLNAWVNKLTAEYNNIYHSAVEFFERRPFGQDSTDPRVYRGAFAAYVQGLAPKETHGVLFAMLDKKDPSPIIWKSIKPRGDDQTFRTEGE